MPTWRMWPQAAPVFGDADEPFPDRDRHPDRPRGVVFLGHRVVEEDHDPVAGEMLEGAFVLDDECPIVA